MCFPSLDVVQVQGTGAREVMLPGLRGRRGFWKPSSTFAVSVEHESLAVGPGCVGCGCCAMSAGERAKSAIESGRKRGKSAGKSEEAQKRARERSARTGTSAGASKAGGRGSA
eukprot:6208337-Pleurochrysis_carterae.AAC.1